MHVGRRGAQIVVLAPAKLNLFLEVLGQRSDGFHELETLMAAVSVFDTLYFEPTTHEKAITFSTKWAIGCEARTECSSGPLPMDDTNLVVRALQLIRQRASCASGARVHLVKRIPSQAGMGGASSNAAAALIAANLGWRLNLDRNVLQELAAQLGSDVPFFLDCGMATCHGRGELVKPHDFTGILFFVIAKPPLGLDTGSVFRHCSQKQRHRKRLNVATDQMRASSIGKNLFNRLQLGASELAVEVRRQEQEFSRLDLCGAQMTGSGTSYFGICRHARHARRVAEILRGRRCGLVMRANIARAFGHTNALANVN